MQLHANAALSLNQRRRMVVRARSGSGATARRAGRGDRSPAPHRIPHRTAADRIEVIEALRRLRMTSSEIAECLGMALSTVSAVLKPISLPTQAAAGAHPARFAQIPRSTAAAMTHGHRRP